MSEMKEVATILNLHITHYTRAWHKQQESWHTGTAKMSERSCSHKTFSRNGAWKNKWLF